MEKLSIEKVREILSAAEVPDVFEQAVSEFHAVPAEKLRELLVEVKRARTAQDEPGLADVSAALKKLIQDRATPVSVVHVGGIKTDKADAIFDPDGVVIFTDPTIPIDVGATIERSDGAALRVVHIRRTPVPGWVICRTSLASSPAEA